MHSFELGVKGNHLNVADRLSMGHHLSRDNQSAVVYARDELTRIQVTVHQMLVDIKTKKFRPDGTKAERLSALINPIEPEAESDTDASDAGPRDVELARHPDVVRPSTTSIVMTAQSACSVACCEEIWRKDTALLAPRAKMRTWELYQRQTMSHMPGYSAPSSKLKSRPQQPQEQATQPHTKKLMAAPQLRLQAGCFGCLAMADWWASFLSPLDGPCEAQEIAVKSSVQRTCTAYGSPSACFFREFSFLECLGLELSGGLCPFCV